MCWERYDAGVQVVTGEGETVKDIHAEQWVHCPSKNHHLYFCLSSYLAMIAPTEKSRHARTNRRHSLRQDRRSARLVCDLALYLVPRRDERAGYATCGRDRRRQAGQVRTVWGVGQGELQKRLKSRGILGEQG
jgi:hypothetical protein